MHDTGWNVTPLLPTAWRYPLDIHDALDHDTPDNAVVGPNTPPIDLVDVDEVDIDTVSTDRAGMDFTGFDFAHDGWTKMPNTLVLQFNRFSSMAELLVVLYVLHHTVGYQDYTHGRRITLDEFCHGRKRHDSSRIDRGTGLSPNAVKAGVRAAIEHGFLIRESDGRDPGRASYVYRLRVTAAQDAHAGSVSPRPFAVIAGRTEAAPDGPAGGPAGQGTGPENDPGYQLLGGEADRDPQHATPRVSKIDSRSGKETDRERKKHLLASARGARIESQTSKPENHRPAATLAGPMPGERLGQLPWEGNRAVQTWRKAHLNAPFDKIIVLGRVLEARLGMRPDWDSRREVSSWLSGLAKCLRAAGAHGDLGQAHADLGLAHADSCIALVLSTALDMRERGLTIPVPYSLVKTVQNAAARARGAQTTTSETKGTPSETKGTSSRTKGTPSQTKGPQAKGTEASLPSPETGGKSEDTETGERARGPSVPVVIRPGAATPRWLH